MAEITSKTSLQELAVIVSQALEAAGIVGTLSGGAAVSIYTNNRYQSYDLDFVTSAAKSKLGRAVEALGFVESEAKRLFAHPDTSWLLEFPAGPLGFGAKVVDASCLEAIDTLFGPSARHHADALRNGPPGSIHTLERPSVLRTGYMGRSEP